MVPHWEYLRWIVYMGAALGTWRYLPLTIVRLVAAFTHNKQRHRQCMEVLRLARRDAGSMPSYLTQGGSSAEGPTGGRFHRLTVPHRCHSSSP
jgi:hypothetical protein